MSYPHIMRAAACLVVLAAIVLPTSPAAARSTSIFQDEARPLAQAGVFLADAVMAGTASAIDGVLDSATAVAAGDFHTCALTGAGGVKCWGSNSYGQLGNGTQVDAASPVDVTGLAGGIAAVVAGDYHTCALSAGGGVKCWGDNSAGQLGDGTSEQRTSPVNVIGLSTGVAALTAGGFHTCALMQGGGMKCWGANSYGQLGDGTETDRLEPVDVINLPGGMAGVAAGGGHTCGVTTGGGVLCWGENAFGQLGNGSPDDSSTPVAVTGLSSGVAELAAGGYHSCARMQSGGAKCWGYNAYGQLGDGSETDRTVPVDVVGLSNVAVVAAGGSHTCAVTSGGAVKCWGENSYGQVGDGTQANRSSPAGVSGLVSGASAVAAGGFHTCALVAGGGILCWGSGFVGQLGHGVSTPRAVPTDVVGLGSGANDLASGSFHSCAVTPAGGAVCWGDNFYGQIGDATRAAREVPAGVTGLSSGVADMAAGAGHSCALTSGGAARCWGRNDFGQVGDGTLLDRTAPVSVSGLASGVIGVVAGDYHSCSLDQAGGVKCWGDNSAGQLGDGTQIDRSTPVPVNGLSSGVEALAAGGFHTCALLQGGSMKCWGANPHGQLGDGSQDDRTTPVPVSGLSGVTSITAGAGHTCAVAGGGAKCWGDNFYGQIGDGSQEDRSTPVDVLGLTGGVVELAAGSSHTCARTQAGAARCWGDNFGGQLGDGTLADRSTPVDVIGLSSGVVRLAAGTSHTCAVVQGDGVKCWGANYFGQLGDGTAWELTPVDALGFGAVLTPRVFLPLTYR